MKGQLASKDIEFPIYKVKQIVKLYGKYNYN